MQSSLAIIKARARALSSKGILSLIVALIFVAVCYAEIMRLGRWKEQRTFRWDVAGYYHYLPSLFIHNDLLNLTYVRTEDPDLNVIEERSWFGIRATEKGHHVNKFTYATALFEMPFFLVAHTIASRPDSGFRPDGYSAPYELSVLLSTILFVAAGLLFLRRFLLRNVDDLSCAIAMSVVAFGTNLFFYSTHDGGMSHGYLFFLYAVVLERTDSWHRVPRRGSAMVIGLCAGLATIMRPVDVLILLVPLLWKAWPSTVVRSKWRLIAANRDHLIIAAIAFLIPLIPQLIYWYAATGKIIYYSYADEGFIFQWSNLMDGLFSYRKGWFVYSPLVLLGFIGMFLMWWKRDRFEIIIPQLIYYPLTIAIVFSWHQWWYGGGFGSRPMVNSLPLLALPTAWLAHFLMHRLRIAWILMCAVIILGIELNLRQQYQYSIGMLHWDSMNKERYWEIFMKKDWDGLREFPYPDPEAEGSQQ